MKIVSLRLLQMLSVVAMSTASANAMADATGEQANQAGDDGQTLDTVVVTAERRAERPQDVPITLSNISAQTLENNDVQSLGEIGDLTSGVRVDGRSAFAEPGIRGITTTLAGVGLGSNVGVYLDGFYSPALQATDFQLMNVDSVQVLKGPQGTLFGRNTVGGAILVDTSKPSADTRAVLEAAYGSYDSQRYNVYATTGLSDKLALDVAGVFNQGDGWVTNIANGNNYAGAYKDYSFRIGAYSQLTDNFSVLARYTHQSRNDPTDNMQNAYVLNGRVLDEGAYLPGGIAATQRGQISADELIKYHFLSDAYQLTATLDFNSWTLASYTQYRKDRTPYDFYSQDYINLPLLALNVEDYNRTITQEFLATSKPGPRLQWTGGVFYYDGYESFPYVGVSTGKVGAPYAFSSASGDDNRSIAAYGDVTYEAISNLFITAGLRYTHDDVEDAFYQVGTSYTTLPTLATSRVTPRGVIRYKVSAESSVYISASDGYKAAIYNVGGFSNVPVKPESLWAYEVGYKYFAGQRFSFDLSSFYYDYTNEQLNNTVIANGAPKTVITNAASSHLYGADADVKYLLFNGLEVNASAEWLHARYVNFPGAPGFAITNAHTYPTALIDASGYAMPRAPDFTANVGGTYTVDVGGGKLALSGNAYYTSKFYFDVAQQLPQKQYATLDLRLAWTNPSNFYTLAVSGKNVTNTFYRTQAAASTLGVASVWAAPPIVEGSIRVNLN